MDDDHLFEFESDFVASLRCIPMAVRMKLDRCGLKVTLRQWSRLSHEDRQTLLHCLCRSPNEVSEYRRLVSDLLMKRAHENVRPLEEASEALQLMSGAIPGSVIDFARSVGLSPPSEADWAALSDLQRFALIKLTRKNHDNVNFAPAMREFALA
jgi:hypothetical protein